MRRILPILLFFSWAAASPSPALAAGEQGTVAVRADRFLTLANAVYQALYRIESEAQWAATTDVKPEHDAAAETAGRARAAFNGNPEVIREAQGLLEHRAELTDLQVRQIQQILLNAAEGPMTNPKIVEDRIAAETAQASALNGFQFRLHGTNATANDLDRLLGSSVDLGERRAIWEASKAIGPALKPGLIRARDLRNRVAAELGHANYFALKTAAYGMSAEDMVRLNDEFMRELRPLYLQIHTWAKHELAKKFRQPVPRRIPAHWINNRWGQEWGGIVEAAKLDRYFESREPDWFTRTAERFYVGLGFPPLPGTFWSRSDLFPVKPGDPRRKNAHASCSQLDLENDIRSLMSVEPTPWWFETAHHELGHAYYFMSYTRPEVPPLLRLGANPAFHEAVGELIGMASMQVPYLQSLEVVPADFHVDPVLLLLDDALTLSVPFLFWASGTMTHWEADVYTRQLPPEQWNARWWELVGQYQGIEPPAPRDESWCDAATKTHINDTPCYYFNYSVATVLKFQFHDYIARHILKQPPQQCNYAGHREAGDWLRRMLEKGATQDWRTVLRDATGEDLGTRAMVEYYRPLMAWLEEQNRGRTIGWESP